MNRRAKIQHDSYFGTAPRAAEVHPAREFVEAALGSYAPTDTDLQDPRAFAEQLTDGPTEERPSIDSIIEYLRLQYIEEEGE
jgi:hypothetical protein